MSQPAYEDDSDVTEITIQPDGRLFVFGLSEEVDDLLRLFQRERAELEASRANRTTEVDLQMLSEG